VILEILGDLVTGNGHRMRVVAIMTDLTFRRRHRGDLLGLRCRPIQPRGTSHQRRDANQAKWSDLHNTFRERGERLFWSC